jgi:hypothetical protein
VVIPVTADEGGRNLTLTQLEVVYLSSWIENRFAVNHRWMKQTAIRRKQRSLWKEFDVGSLRRLM